MTNKYVIIDYSTRTRNSTRWYSFRIFVRVFSFHGSERGNTSTNTLHAWGHRLILHWRLQMTIIFEAFVSSCARVTRGASSIFISSTSCLVLRFGVAFAAHKSIKRPKHDADQRIDDSSQFIATVSGYYPTVLLFNRNALVWRDARMKLTLKMKRMTNVTDDGW